MPCPLHTLLLSLLLFSSLLPALTSSDSGADVIAELTSLRSNSPDGVIRLSDKLLRRLMSVPGRSFSFSVFFDAVQLHDMEKLQLRDLRSQYGVVSSSFLLNHPDSSDLFFFDMDFIDSHTSFHLFGVHGLPHIRIVTPSVDNLRNSHAMDKGNFNSLSDSLSSLVESKTNVSIGTQTVLIEQSRFTE